MNIPSATSPNPKSPFSLQYFADRDMFCAGRVTEEDLNRTWKACGGSIQTTVHDLNDATLGLCETFEEKQVCMHPCLLIGDIVACSVFK